MKEFVRKITKTARYTYYITIPKDYIRELGWQAHQKLVVKRVGKKHGRRIRINAADNLLFDFAAAETHQAARIDERCKVGTAREIVMFVDRIVLAFVVVRRQPGPNLAARRKPHHANGVAVDTPVPRP